MTPPSITPYQTGLDETRDPGNDDPVIYLNNLSTMAFIFACVTHVSCWILGLALGWDAPLWSIVKWSAAIVVGAFVCNVLTVQTRDL